MKPATFWGFFWFFLGAASMGSIPLLEREARGHFKKNEPYFLCPVPTSENYTVKIRNDSYGKGHFRASRNGNRTHQGIDLSVGIGEPVTAAKSGRVRVSGVGKGYGNYVELIHPDGLKTRYAHLSSLNVKVGEWVSGKDLVGAAGKTGNADDRRIKPHLHFEIKKGDIALDPTHLFDPLIKISK